MHGFSTPIREVSMGPSLICSVTGRALPATVASSVDKEQD